MRSRLLLLLLVVSTATTCTAVVVWAQARPVPEGQKRYEPTRLEWLTVELNSKFRVPMSAQKQYSILFTTVHDRNDTIVIWADHYPNADREMMNRDVDSKRKIAQMVAKGRGWDGWLNVVEKVNLLELKK